MSRSYYSQTELYEASFADRVDDVRFFVDAVGEVPRSVLELGAGTGRVTLPLAQAGHSVVALDLSPEMLSVLQSRLEEEPSDVRERVAFQLGDARSFSLAQRFDRVLGTFNVVGHLHTERELKEFLSTALNHLEPGGQILFDCMVPSPEEMLAVPGERFELDPVPDPSSGAFVVPYEEFSFDESRALLTTRCIYPFAGGALETELVLRLWFPHELRRFTAECGFSEVELLADYSNSTDLSAADMVVVRAFRPASSSGA